jgi:hypothetical protein
MSQAPLPNFLRTAPIGPVYDAAPARYVSGGESAPVALPGFLGGPRTDVYIPTQTAAPVAYAPSYAVSPPPLPPAPPPLPPAPPPPPPAPPLTPGYPQALQGTLRPIYDQQGQVVAFVNVPNGPTTASVQGQTTFGQNGAPMPSANQRTGRAVLSTATTGLTVAGPFFPPALAAAGIVGLTQALDAQIGSPITKVVGGVVNGIGTVGAFVGHGVVSMGEGVGSFVGSIFGGKKHRAQANG